MGSPLNDDPLIEDPYFIRIPDGAQSMGDGEGGHTTADGRNHLLNLVFGFGVDVRGSFVEK